MTRRFIFIGVTTAQSSMVRIFPRWCEILGLGEAELVGRDLPIHAPQEVYREAISALRADRDTVGALVTTHKIDLYRAAADLFDDLDRDARLLGEISCIARRGDRLLGWAKDPLSAGETLREMLGPGYFGDTGAEILIFGAGGAALAITLDLLTRPDSGDRPRRMTVTDRDSTRLSGVQALHQAIGSEAPVVYVETADPRVNDGLVSWLPRRSLVVNATGMGKDTPGSPVTDEVLFPEEGIAWDLNYRGELTFLRQARAQETARQVRAVDGWRYFIHGWATILAEVFERSISPAELRLLADAATFARPARA
jgi:shikimate 5-dehydrogenase